MPFAAEARIPPPPPAALPHAPCAAPGMDETRFVRVAAATTHPVLLIGETGSGKSHLARHIHDTGGRAGKPFVHVNCAAIPDALFEREMFGHVRGAYTDAKDTQPGFFESANGGTLLLDELGELPLHVQPKLLTILESGVVRRLGSSREHAVDVRIISASNRDLWGMLSRQAFRPDLFFRCAVLQFEVPPLRARKSDFGLLVARTLARVATDGPVRVSDEALEQLRAYPWPGNLRELENALRHGSAFCDGGEVGPEHLPDHIRAHAPGTPRYVAPCDADDERRRIRDALEAELGNRTRAARRLGMSRATLWTKLQRYGLADAPAPHLRALS
jgi:two-component system response regulator HydG